RWAPEHDEEEFGIEYPNWQQKLIPYEELARLRTLAEARAWIARVVAARTDAASRSDPYRYGYCPDRGSLTGGPSTPPDSRGHDLTVNERPAWEQRILDTREAINRAIAAHDQASADAQMANVPVSQLARVLGRQDRTGLYRA